jgi:mono/diheme cytochrome c family protein
MLQRLICHLSCRLLIAAAALLTAAGSAAGFPWSIDMFRGASVQPLAVAPRVMPPGTLPMSGGEPPMSRETAAPSLHNPFSPTAKRLKHGKKLFETTCAPCHGSDGKGNGTVRFLLAIPPANLTRAQPTERSDGYLYATIRNGSITMPAYGDTMSPEERWDVVMYLRWLQGKVAVK